MEKSDGHIFVAITQSRNKKKQPNKSTIMTHLSEKLKELNIDKQRLTQRLKWLVEYTKLENKQRNGVSSCYNISSDIQRTELPHAPNSLDTYGLDNCPNKELK